MSRNIRLCQKTVKKVALLRKALPRKGWRSWLVSTGHIFPKDTFKNMTCAAPKGSMLMNIIPGATKHYLCSICLEFGNFLTSFTSLIYTSSSNFHKAIHQSSKRTELLSGVTGLLELIPTAVRPDQVTSLMQGFSKTII